MRYFMGNRKDMLPACEEVWRRQDEADKPSSSISQRVKGQDACVWVKDSDGEALYRQILQKGGIQFTESDEQQVVTDVDDWLR